MSAEQKDSVQEAGSSKESSGEKLMEETKAKLEQFANSPDKDVADAAKALLPKIEGLPKDSATLKNVNEKLWQMEGSNARVDREKFAAFAGLLAGNLS